MNIFKRLMNRVLPPKKEYTITLIAEDFQGSKFKPEDCIGARALKRASGKEVSWADWFGNIDHKLYIARNESGTEISMMYNARVGDTITFKRED